MKVGVLGGTFDPIHLGHLILAECARQQLGLDRVVFLPAGDPWRKADRKVLSAQHRLVMVKLAIAENAAFVVDTSEIERGGPSYTAETLRRMREGLGDGDELYFLLGRDALDDMRYWNDPGGIVASAKLAVAPREGTAVPSPPGAGHRPRPFDMPPFIELDMPRIGISATDLRARAKRGLSLRYLVPDGVDAYILKKRLYRD